MIALTGPRQSGKTTLARAAFPDRPYVSLEDLDELALAERDPRGFLARFPGGAVIDEAQRCPVIFSYLQGRVDAERQMGAFVLTGSQQFGLMVGNTQTLAGRVGSVQLLPFGLYELAEAGLAQDELDRLMLRGLYPAIYDRPLDPSRWYADYVATYVERDVRQMSAIHDLSLFRRFVAMCAARTGQLLNLHSLANDCGISHPTARAWLSILEASYVVFLLQPHHRNFGKRLVKTPKLYFHDTGLAAMLLGIQDEAHMSVHPSRPALFETLVVNEFLKVRYNHGQRSNLYFWRDHVGNEIDLLLEYGAGLMAVEIKSGRTMTSDYLIGLHKWSVLAGSGTQQLHLVFGGDRS
ncbi:MAG: ATP-binding protein, partial [Burkholderiales bacterium]|nr:ATP-binding protein [Burkholderiales bacterium]